MTPVAPSQAAVERVLWLAAVDRCLRLADGDALPVREGYRALRRLIDRAGASLYAATPTDDDAELAWIVAARDALDAGTPGERAAVVLWAAVGAWTDAPDGRWGTLADAGAELAAALDRGTGAGARTGRAASKLRAVMVATWEVGR